MAKGKNNIKRKIWVDTTAVIVLALLLMPLHSWLYGTSLLNMSEKSSAAASSLSYDIQRLQTPPVHSDEIALVDISDIIGPTARVEIADLLGAIYAMDPKLIGVDVFFPESHTSYNPIADEIDSILDATAHRIADKAVFVCQLDSFDSDLKEYRHINHSFFINSQQSDDTIQLSEGYANLLQNSSGNDICNYTIRQKADGKYVWSFAAKIVADYIDETEDLDRKPIIRFEPTDFLCMTPDQLEPDSIRDRIVLVGDMRDRGDSHLTPLGMMQGMEVHAYSVQTILHYNDLAGAPYWLLALICLVVCFLYTYVLFFIDFKLDVHSNNLLKFAIRQGMFTLATTYLINIVLQYIAYVSFTVFDTTLGLHALLPDLIKLVAFTKVTYSILVPLLHKRFGWKWLNHSFLLPTPPTKQTPQTTYPHTKTTKKDEK
ncbi:MAG: CHASE2 domain-containing protein [Bacteroidaceae bacterium]|nr:CHASE2 domain-containing protein [Bacteroidaceae bacterium]